jgi:hypothetical protein
MLEQVPTLYTALGNRRNATQLDATVAACDLDDKTTRMGGTNA